MTNVFSVGQDVQTSKFAHKNRNYTATHGKTQFVLFGRMQFVLKVCSMHEVIVCSTGFSLFYQKTVG